MFTHELKSVVFRGKLRPRTAASTPPTDPTAPTPPPQLDLCRTSGKPTRYSILPQTAADLRDQSNSPSISMWPYLLASAQTQRLNQISIYSENGTTAEATRLLYLNDAALTIWAEMKKNTKTTGRLQRPPRTATLAFGMPFAE